MKILIALLFISALLWTIPASARHAASCATRAKFVELLTKRYGESIRVTGVLMGSTGVMEIWQSAKGNWSILMTLPTGQSCMIATGTGLEIMEAPLPGSPS